MNLKFQHPGASFNETEYSSGPQQADELSAVRKPAAEHPVIREAPPASPGIVFTPDFTACADEILFV